MEDKGLPTVGDVITKLKSDGTFDNFRKSCVNSIENEVCVIKGYYQPCNTGFFRTRRTSLLLRNLSYSYFMSGIRCN